MSDEYGEGGTLSLPDIAKLYGGCPAKKWIEHDNRIDPGSLTKEDLMRAIMLLDKQVKEENVYPLVEPMTQVDVNDIP